MGFHPSCPDLQASCCRLVFYARGVDRPGISSEFCGCLSYFGKRVELLDISQIRVESMCCLCFVVKAMQGVAVEVLKSVLLTAALVEFEVDYKVSSLLSHDVRSPAVTADTPTTSVGTDEPEEALVLQLVEGTPQLSAKLLAALAEELEKSGLSVRSLHHENVPVLSGDGYQAVELQVAAVDAALAAAVSQAKLLLDCGDMADLYLRLQKECWTHDAEVVIRRPDQLFQPKSRCLVVFGLNETLILEEMVDEMLREVELEPKVFEAPSADAGQAALKLKLQALRGQPLAMLRRVLKRLTLSRDAHLLCHSLALLGYRTALMTQGFDFVANIVGKSMGFGHVLCNHLEVDDEGRLTGRLTGESVGVDSTHLMDPLRKVDWLQLLRDKMRVPRSNVFVVGDYKHADFLMQSCGCRIYFNSKKHGDLRRVFSMMGFKLRDIEQLECRHRRLFPRFYSGKPVSVWDLSQEQSCAQMGEDGTDFLTIVTRSPCASLTSNRGSSSKNEAAVDDSTSTTPTAATMTCSDSCAVPAVDPSLSSSASSGAPPFSSSSTSSMSRRFKASVYIYGEWCPQVSSRLLGVLCHSKKPVKLVLVRQSHLRDAFFMGLVIAWTAASSAPTSSEPSEAMGNGRTSELKVASGGREVWADVLKDLVFEANLMGLKVHFDVSEMMSSENGLERLAASPPAAPNGDNFVDRGPGGRVRVRSGPSGGRNSLASLLPTSSSCSSLLSSAGGTGRRYIVVVVGEPSIEPPLLERIFRAVSNCRYNVEEMKRLSCEGPLKVLQLIVSCDAQTASAEQKAKEGEELAELKTSLLTACREHSADVAVQAQDISRYCRRFVVFDMDSTLIQQEVIDEIARCAGVQEEVAEITERAMKGQIDFHESLLARVALLKGMHSSLLANVERRLVFTPGAARLCRVLRLLGFRLAVVSGGFTQFARYVKRQLGLHHAFANSLEIDPKTGRLTGRVVGPVVTPQRKASILQMLADVDHCSVEQVIAVGDGANDIPMLLRAGMGVAFCAKPKVQETAEFRINHKNLFNLLYLIGVSEQATRKLEKQRVIPFSPTPRELISDDGEWRIDTHQEGGGVSPDEEEGYDHEPSIKMATRVKHEGIRLPLMQSKSELFNQSLDDSFD